MENKNAFQSKTLWGIILAWVGIKMQAVLTPYGVPADSIKAFTDLLTEGGLMLAVIGRAVATKKLGL